MVTAPLHLNALQRLIQARRDEHGWSYAQIAERAGLPKSTVHKIAAVPWAAAPTMESLDRLAIGLQLPPAVIRAAAADALGLTAHVEQSDTEEGMSVLIGSIRSLDPVQRAQVTALVDAMVKASQQ